MFGSFTQQEKWMFCGVLAILGVGTATVPWFSNSKPTQVFSVAQRTNSTTATLQSSSAPSRPGGGSALTSAVAPNGLIDLNTATPEALDALPGIGPSKAKAIIQLRNQRGGFKSVAELDDVPGIGPANMAKLVPYVTVAGAANGPAAAAASQQGAVPMQRGALATPFQQAPPQYPVASGAAPQNFAAQQAKHPQQLLAQPQGAYIPAPAPPTRAAPRSGGGAEQYSGVVNINTASSDVLATLKGVGPVLAQRILEYRAQHGGFRSAQELDAVKGIGPHIMDENRGRISVN